VTAGQYMEKKLPDGLKGKVVSKAERTSPDSWLITFEDGTYLNFSANGPLVVEVYYPTQAYKADQRFDL